MSYDKADTERLLALVEKHVKSSPDFSQDDWNALHEFTQALRGLYAIGRAAKWVIVFLGLVAAGVASTTTLASAFKDWIK